MTMTLVTGSGEDYMTRSFDPVMCSCPCPIPGPVKGWSDHECQSCFRLIPKGMR